ncbi:proline-rich acidic protein 1 [Excalfactoria chinensis]|uniref:proline-rich acidic protein 1 n=1 Tax=Excalfactoria chinensis TaxID=46218 RepID=UPI003B3AA279
MCHVHDGAHPHDPHHSPMQPHSTHTRGQSAVQGCCTGRGTMGPCSVTMLLGAALLLLAPGGNQALGGLRQDVDVEQNLAKETVQAPQAAEEAKLAKDTASRPLFPPDPAWVQVGPEQDRDHLYHPSDRVEVEPEPRSHRERLVLSAEVENGPSEDRDHLYHS